MRKHPASVGWTENLYNFPTYQNRQLNFEILFFRQLDQQTSNVFDKLRTEAEPALTPEETHTLTVFLMTLLHRTPAGVSSMRDLSKRMYNEIRERLRPRYLEIRGPNDPPTVEEYEEQRGAEAYLEHFSNVFRTVVSSQRVGNFLASMSWRRISVPNSCHNLLLSDDPLIRTNGLARADGHLLFPIAPKVAIIGATSEDHLNIILDLAPKVLVRQMNQQAVGAARHFIVDSNEDQIIFIRNRFGTNIRPTLSEQSLTRK